MSEKFEKITKVRLPFDRRHKDPSQNYGVSGLSIWFILKGKKGAVQFQCYFHDAVLPHVKKSSVGGDIGNISGFDVGYHAREPQYEGQSEMENCNLFPDGKCYYDGSSLRAAEWAKEIFSVRGKNPEEVLWPMLEQEYKERFGDE